MITLFRNIKSQIIKLFSCMIIGICAIIGSINAANAIDYSFQVQTAPLAIRSRVYFNISATGTFYVDCGTDGGLYDADRDEPTPTTIINSNNNVARLYCKYISSGTKYIRFGGQATGYSNNYSTPAISFGALEGYGKVNAGNSNKIYSLSGSLATIFPYLGARSDGLAPSFYGSFSGITSLQYIDSSMFSGYSGNLSGANYMFLFTFINCTSLQSIPSGLFSP